jgi:hypothetical protein
MTRGTVTFLLDLDVTGDTMYLGFSLDVGTAPFQFKIYPSNPIGEPTPYDLGTLLEKLASALNIDALSGVAGLSNDGIWSEVFKVWILPELLVTPTGPDPSLQAVLKVFSGNNGDTYGLTIGVSPITIGGLTIQIEPQITIYEFGIQYTSANGLKLDAVVDYGEVAGTDMPVISSATSAQAKVGTPFSYSIVASNSPTSYAATPLPAGLTVDASGNISGTPTEAGTTNVALSATNAAGTGSAGLMLMVDTTKAIFAPPKSAQKVGYPFPTPATKDTSSFCVKYFGIGQRLGIDVDLNNPNPISAALTELESELSSTTPVNILPKLATYYHPDRDWFVAIDIYLKGWELRALFNDPSLYGIEISSTIGQFSGFDFEILYQKLGPKNGVYYGAITLPTKYRTIQLGAASLTLPNFKLWIYTDGDFRFAVGWPLWDDIFTVEVEIFTGGGGLYFGKLRSGDLPKPSSNGGASNGPPAITYNPILEFGLGLELGLGRDFTAGPLSASLFVGMRGVFQGLLAWQVTGGTPGSLSNSPDYFWFSASVSLVGIVNGSVDLAIVSLSFSINISITTTLAFETGCKSLVDVDAYVSVSATLKILFVHVTVRFHTTVHVSFTFGSGDCTACPLGPTNPNFQNAIPSGGGGAVAAPLMRPRAMPVIEMFATTVTATSAPALIPPKVALHFLLYPAVDYNQSAGNQLQAVCGLNMESDQFLSFLQSIGSWLISQLPAPGAMTAITIPNPIVITSVGHGLSNGATIIFAGSAFTPNLDGPQTITETPPGTFTVPTAGLANIAGCWMPVASPTGKITQISVANPTVVTSVGHGLSTGDTIVITGSDSTPTIDGQQVVTALTPDTFSAAVPVTVAGTTGSWQKAVPLTTLSAPNPAVLSGSFEGVLSEDTAIIAGCNTVRTLDGRRTVTVVSPDIFTVEADDTAVGVTGTWTISPWATIATRLGVGVAGPPENFRSDIRTFLSTGTFTINGVDLGGSSPVTGTITNISFANPTVITSAGHNLATNDSITIAGSNSTPSIDGLQIVTVLTADTFTVPVKVTAAGTTGTWEKNLQTCVFAVPPVLELSSAALATPRDFAQFAMTNDTYGEVLDAYLAALSQIDGRIIGGDTGDDDDHTMADIVFYDYLLLVCRQLAHEMQGGGDITTEVAGQVAGVASHYLLHGLRLPKSGTPIPPPNQSWNENDIAGLYALTGQQFTVQPPGGKAGPISAALSTSGSITNSDPDWPLAQAFKFASGSSATSHLPVPATPPPAPIPGWNQNEMTVAQLPGIVSADLWLGVHNRVQWTHTGASGSKTQGIVQMPERISNLADAETLTLKMYAQPQPDTNPYTFTYALRIPLDISTVSRRRDVDATASADGKLSPTGTDLPGIYQIQGVDDADRDRLGAIINELVGNNPPNVTLHVLLPSSNPPGFTSSDEDEKVAMFLKTSLATTSSPGMHTAPIEILAVQAMAAATEIDPVVGPVAASLADVSGVLQLLYEASIVHSGGFFLNWPGSDGKGLPTSVFKDGTAELELLISMPDATSVQEDVQNVLVTEKETAATVYLQVMDGNGAAVPDPHPNLPQGSIGFNISNLPPPPDPTLHPFDPPVIQSLYSLVQFRIDGSGGGSAYDTSVWSSAVGAMSPAKDATADPLPPTYLASLPVWKFVNGVNPADPTKALAGIGNAATLDFRLVDVFGNPLPLNGYSKAFQRLYDDPIVPPSTWPGAHLGYTVTGDGQSDPTLTITLSFEPNQKWDPQNGKLPDLSQVIQRYQQAVAQVSDSDLNVGLATDLMIGVPTAPDARTQLQKFATNALAYIQARAAGQTPPPVPSVTISAALTRADVAQLPYNIFQVTVDLNLSRPANLVDPSATTLLPDVQSVTTHVRPLIVEDAQDDAPLSLKAFAQAFEEAYAGFDGQTATKLKVTVRAEKTNHPTQIGPIELWAVRMSSTSGIALSLPAAVPAVAFTMEPVSTELSTGTVDVTTYDSALEGTTTSRTFNGIALDDWMSAFLVAMDSLLSPSSAPVLARLSATNPAIYTPFERLMAAKEEIAKQLALRVVPVFQPETGQGTGWPGDLASAQDKFEQTLLENLSQAYSINVIMQTQVTVSETGKAEPNLKVPPRFYGALQPRAIKTITAIAPGNPAAITSAAHGLSTGDSIFVAGSNSTPLIDGVQTVTVLSPDTFSVAVDVTAAGTTAFWQNYKEPIAEITSIAASNPSIVTSAGHGLSPGDKIVVTGSNSIPLINGIQTVTVLSPDTFSVAVNVTTAGTTGSWQIYRKPITAITKITAQNPAVVTSPGHGLSMGASIIIAGSDSNPTIDGYQAVIVQSPDTFTVAVNVKAAGTKGAWQLGPGKAYTLSNSTLALPMTSDAAEQALTWTISVKHPEDDAFLDLTRDYNIGFMEHYIDLDADGNPVVDPDEPYGYVPSSWLRFVVTEDPLLNHPLNEVSAPIPLHEFPPTPTIGSQKAESDPQQAKSGDPIGTIIEDALEWDYTLTVAERELDDEQDDLWLMISYNLDGSGGITHSEVTGDAVGEAQNLLFAPLAQFTTSYRSLSALLPQLQVGAKPTANLTTLAEILAGLAENVSSALGATPSNREGAFAEVTDGSTDKPPKAFTDTYVVEFLHARDKLDPYLTVYAQITSPITAIAAGDPAIITSVAHGLSTGDSIVIAGSNSSPKIDGPQKVTVTSPDTFTIPVNVTGAGTAGFWEVVIWPDIAWLTDQPIVGTTGKPNLIPVQKYGVMSGYWVKATYEHFGSAPADKLPQMEIRWQKLSILDRQTVRPQVQIVRNADLADAASVKDMITNPALVYSTPLITSSRLVPYIDVSQRIDVPFATDLPTTLTQILTPLLGADTTVGTARKFKFKAGYEYALSTPAQGEPLTASDAILLVDGLEIGNGGISVEHFANNVSDQIIAWMIAAGTNNGVQRWIPLAISLFADLDETELPLISLSCVRIVLPPNWKPPPR